VVDLTLVREPTLVEDAPPSRERAADLLRAMPNDHQSVDGTQLSFSRQWRWHPRDNEELVVAEWKAQPDDKTAPFFELVVYKECGGRPSRIARMRGPADKLERLRETSPEKLALDVSTEKDKGEITLSYWYGSVKLVEPDWVKAGNRLERKAATSKGPLPGVPAGIGKKLRPIKR
jgi:hypothetical protein